MSAVDVRERALKTLVQAALVALPVFFQALDGRPLTVKTFWAAVVAGGSAGASVVWNTFKNRRA